MAPNVDRKTHKHLFLEVISKKGFHDLCGRKFVAKSRKKTLRASLGKFGQKSLASPKIFQVLHLLYRKMTFLKRDSAVGVFAWVL